MSSLKADTLSVSPSPPRNRIRMRLGVRQGFPGGAVVKSLPANAGDARDVGSILESGKSPGVRNGNLLQYSCLENPMGRGTWWATVHGVTESNTTE